MFVRQVRWIHVCRNYQIISDAEEKQIFWHACVTITIRVYLKYLDIRAVETLSYIILEDL